MLEQFIVQGFYEILEVQVSTNWRIQEGNGINSNKTWIYVSLVTVFYGQHYVKYYFYETKAANLVQTDREVQSGSVSPHTGSGLGNWHSSFFKNVQHIP